MSDIQILYKDNLYNYVWRDNEYSIFVFIYEHNSEIKYIKILEKGKERRRSF